MSILALDVGGTAIKSALFEDDGRISMAKETPSQAKCGGTLLTVMRVIRRSACR